MTATGALGKRTKAERRKLILRLDFVRRADSFRRNRGTVMSMRESNLSKAWVFEEARKVVARAEKLGRDEDL